MLRKAKVVLMVFALGATLSAAEEAQAPMGYKPPAPAPASAAAPAVVPAAASITRTDQVLSRLVLTDEQIKAIDRLVTEDAERQRELFKLSGMSPAARAERTKQLTLELKRNIRGALTNEQQQRFDAGWRSINDCQAKIQNTLKDSQRVASGHSTGNAAREAANERIRDLKADMAKQLDEKVGQKRPASESK